MTVTGETDRVAPRRPRPVAGDGHGREPGVRDGRLVDERQQLARRPTLRTSGTRRGRPLRHGAGRPARRERKHPGLGLGVGEPGESPRRTGGRPEPVRRPGATSAAWRRAWTTVADGASAPATAETDGDAGASVEPGADRASIASTTRPGAGTTDGGTAGSDRGHGGLQWVDHKGGRRWSGRHRTGAGTIAGRCVHGRTGAAAPPSSLADRVGAARHAGLVRRSRSPRRGAAWAAAVGGQARSSSPTKPAADRAPPCPAIVGPQPTMPSVSSPAPQPPMAGQPLVTVGDVAVTQTQ